MFIFSIRIFHDYPSFLLFCCNKKIKNGVPMVAVITPTGISVGAAIVLPMVSHIIIKLAPATEAKGNN
jgi:hypothetical protein